MTVIYLGQPITYRIILVQMSVICVSNYLISRIKKCYFDGVILLVTLFMAWFCQIFYWYCVLKWKTMTDHIYFGNLIVCMCIKEIY